MHDIHEANRMANIIRKHTQENQIIKLSNIKIELGYIIEHGDDISPENLDFNLRMILKDLINNQTKIEIKKVEGESWKLISIEGQ